MILNFGHNIVVDSGPLSDKDAKGWVPVVHGNLLTIAKSATGRCVLHQFVHWHKHVRITPYTSSDQNAVTGGVNNDDKDAYYKFRPVRDGQGGYEGATGTGKGVNVGIQFTPWRFAANEQAVTLLHELVHGAEEAAGVEYCNPIPWDFTTTADFDTILVENIFRSENGLVSRKNHAGWVPLTGKLVPQPDAYKRLLASFKARMPSLAAGLAKVHAPFNPLRKGAAGWVGT